MTPEIRIKRIYDAASDDEGYRILVDRLWPRGVSKADAHIDLWAKELTPSHDLRKWFHEHAERTTEFADRYIAELESRTDQIDELLSTIDRPVWTLITAAKLADTGHVAILKRFLQQRFQG